MNPIYTQVISLKKCYLWLDISNIIKAPSEAGLPMIKTRSISAVTKLVLILIAISVAPDVFSRSGYPRKELPFCPGGGPPGWMNYFDYKRDQNIMRRYPLSRPAYLRPGPNTYFYQGYSLYPAYTGSRYRSNTDQGLGIHQLPISR
jgi:hypothetical protein